MSYARDMLDSTPGGTDLGADEVVAAIEACLNCGQACTACSNACLAEDDVAAMRECIALDDSCADLCSVTARALSRPVYADQALLWPLLQACVGACASCAEECARHGEHHRHCAICAQACRACAKACTALLEAEAFAELRNLAGG
ncbi:MAG TPA: four-helix bundle copper-binding protein [Solirubrobacteraceae bacterium]|jgi:hypothetical protein|nr:four-helix bundle copper-binding protein [Solirubrobacteraceae bacterium]